MKEAIQKAIEGGWKPEYKDHKLKKAVKRMGVWAEKGNSSSYIDFKYALIDRTFWQCLGKALGWRENVKSAWGTLSKRKLKEPIWIYHWHRSIDHLASGGNVDSFFKELLTP